jgi:hypothetical protein
MQTKKSIDIYVVASTYSFLKNSLRWPLDQKNLLKRALISWTLKFPNYSLLPKLYQLTGLFSHLHKFPQEPVKLPETSLVLNFCVQALRFTQWYVCQSLY